MEKHSIEGTWRDSRAEVGDVEPSGAENKYIRHAWMTTGDSTLGVRVQQQFIME